VRNHVGPVQSDEQEAASRPRPDPADIGEGCFDLRVCHARKGLLAQAPVDEPLRECAKRLALANRETDLVRHLRISCEQLRRRGHVAPEVLLQMRDDCRVEETDTCWLATPQTTLANASS
jgi:hypothetical protein